MSSVLEQWHSYFVPILRSNGVWMQVLGREAQASSEEVLGFVGREMGRWGMLILRLVLLLLLLLFVAWGWEASGLVGCFVISIDGVEG